MERRNITQVNNMSNEVLISLCITHLLMGGSASNEKWRNVTREIVERGNLAVKEGDELIALAEDLLRSVECET